MAAFLALFRGINVGGNQIVKMSELKAVHEALSLRDVATYIQSGNVVFTSDDMDEPHLAQRIEANFAEKFGFRADVVVRSAAAMRDIIARNPFQDQAAKDPKRIAVMFLRDCPTEQAQADLLTSYVGPEEIHISGSEMFTYYPDGMGRTKLTMPLIVKKLQTTGTARNWNTMMRLMDLLAARDASDR